MAGCFRGSALTIEEALMQCPDTSTEEKWVLYVRPTQAAVPLVDD